MGSTTTDRRIGLNSGAAFKVPCKAASTANLVLSGEQTVDGVACVTGDRVLVKNQTDQTANGIWVVSTASWTRDLDFDGNLDAVTGTQVMTLNGNTNSNSFWRLATIGAINLGSSLISFARSFVNDSALISFIQSGIGAVARTVQDELRLRTNILQFGASPSASASANVASIQAAIDITSAAGGGTVLIPANTTFFAVNASITVTSNVRLEFEGWIKLTAPSTLGDVLHINGDNVEIINPLIDANNIATNGENGIGVVSGNNIHIRGGKIKNCAGSASGGGKGIQIESGGVEGFIADGTEFSNCFMAMSTIRDGTNVAQDYGILFSNIKADNCNILFFVRQVTLNNTNGLEHTVQLNNFYAVNCGAYEGVMQFSRAANVQVSNGVIVNSGAVTALIRGNHRFCRFDNIRFSGDCSRIIDIDPGTLCIDSSYPCENNTYDINYSGTAAYLAYADITTTNRILSDCKIVANLDSDVTTKIISDELRNGYCELFVTQGGRTIITTTATFYLEGRSTVALYPAGISMPRFNSSQITFPATQVSSFDVNTLDDYEEGTWTPTDTSGAALTLSTAIGNYTKIGRMVYASFSITYPVTANGSTASIGGLPYSAAAGNQTGGFAPSYTDFGSFISALKSASDANFLFASLSAAFQTNTNMSGKSIRGAISYMTAT